MNPRLKFALIAVGIGVVAWIVIGIVLAGREPAPPPPGGQPIVSINGKVTGNRISTRSWTFNYKRVQMSADGVNASIDDLYNGVLYKKGKPYLRMSAKQVSANTQTLDFIAVGTVRIETIPTDNSAPRSFETDLVQWTNATKLLVLSHPSIVRTGDQILKVANITVDFNKSEVRLGRIEGALQAPQ